MHGMASYMGWRRKLAAVFCAKGRRDSDILGKFGIGRFGIGKAFDTCPRGSGSAGGQDQDARPVAEGGAGAGANTDAAAEAPEHLDRAAFRAVMRQQACAVSIIAGANGGQRAGLTATSVSSLSDDPPSLLVCVNRDASAHSLILNSRFFSVSFLTEAQRDDADRFSGASGFHGEDRFISDHWHAGVTGAPVLKDALAVLECDLIEQHSFATHSIFIGRVCAAVAREDAAPLVYFRAGYGTVR